MDSQPGTILNELAASQLIRYEALFKLIEEMQGIEDVAALSALVARQWKYFARVSGWRLVVFNGFQHLVIDGFRGEAFIDTVVSLSNWDTYFHGLEVPRSILPDQMEEEPRPPEHLSGKAVKEIRVIPFLRSGRWIALLSVSVRNEPFSDVDIKFLRLFGNYFADRVSDILRRQQATEALLQKATRDSLTNLYNRGAILERLQEKVALARRTNYPLSVILADIDFFKTVNDSYGHIAGDNVLREISRRFKMELRDSDNLGRYGGEEFLFVLFPCSVDEVRQAAERFRAIIARTPFLLDSDNPQSFTVTVSFGAASSTQEFGMSMNDLIKKADNALYQSKATGRNCVTVAPSDTTIQLRTAFRP